jgi:hypothetical protein
MPEGSEQLDAPDDDRIPEDQWDPQTGELPPLSGEEAEFKKLALEAATRGHEQLATLYKNSNARNRRRIEDWKDELEARYPTPERPPDAEGGTAS